MPMGYKKEPKCPSPPAQKPGGGSGQYLNPLNETVTSHFYSLFENNKKNSSP